MLFACTNEKGAVNVCLFESNDYGMTRVRRRITQLRPCKHHHRFVRLLFSLQVTLYPPSASSCVVLQLRGSNTRSGRS
jgi:hypothetical protein